MNNSTDADIMHPMTRKPLNPAEISLACKKIRANWTPDERLRRQVGQSSCACDDDEFCFDESDGDNQELLYVCDIDDAPLKVGDYDDSDFFHEEGSVIASGRSSVA